MIDLYCSSVSVIGNPGIGLSSHYPMLFLKRGRMTKLR